MQSRQNWLNQTNKNQPGRFVEENYKYFVCLGLQQSPTMVVRRIKAWLKLQNGKPLVLPSCIGRVHAEFLGYTRSGHWRWPNVEHKHCKLSDNHCNERRVTEESCILPCTIFTARTTIISKYMS